MTWAAHTRSASQRGYDGTHRRLRATLLPTAYGTACPICWQTMLDSQTLSLDHVVPKAAGGRTEMGNVRITHNVCNVRRGAAYGSARRWGKPRRLSRRSREW
jgi:5-methylcytosine-specific restriction endonuclease McrA